MIKANILMLRAGLVSDFCCDSHKGDKYFVERYLKIASGSIPSGHGFQALREPTTWICCTANWPMKS